VMLAARFDVGALVLKCLHLGSARDAVSDLVSNFAMCAVRV